MLPPTRATATHTSTLSGAAALADRSARARALRQSARVVARSRISFVATFVAMYTLSPRLWAQLRNLFTGQIAPRCALTLPGGAASVANTGSPNASCPPRQGTSRSPHSPRALAGSRPGASAVELWELSSGSFSSRLDRHRVLPRLDRLRPLLPGCSSLAHPHLPTHSTHPHPPKPPPPSPCHRVWAAHTHLSSRPTPRRVSCTRLRHRCALNDSRLQGRAGPRPFPV